MFVVAGLVISALAFQVLAATFWGVMAGAALFGVAWGFGDMIAKAFPSYLTNVPAELKNINSVIFTVSNVAVVAGPVAGGALAAAVSTRAVFLLLAGCALISLLPALGFRALREPRRSEPRGKGADGSALSSGFASVSSTPALALLFWSCLFAFFGYGAFDPLESLYYRDVLQVGVAWMGWLSAASGVGAVAGALLVLCAGILVYPYYTVKNGRLYSSMGILHTSYDLADVTELMYFKAQGKLVMYFSAEKFVVIMLAESKHDDFVKALREVNPKIIYDNKINENDCDIKNENQMKQIVDELNGKAVFDGKCFFQQ